MLQKGVYSHVYDKFMIKSMQWSAISAFYMCFAGFRSTSDCFKIVYVLCYPWNYIISPVLSFSNAALPDLNPIREWHSPIVPDSKFYFTGG